MKLGLVTIAAFLALPAVSFGASLQIPPIVPVAAEIAILQSNPYQSVATHGLPKLIQSAEFGEPGSDARLAAWLKTNPQAPIEDRRIVNHRLCTDYQARNDYAAAAITCTTATALGTDDAQSAAINSKLRNLPVIRAIGSTRITLTRNGLGSRNAEVEVNGIRVPWLMDTGAQITVISASLSIKLGVRLLDGDAKIGSTTGNVQGRIGFIDLLHIGTASVENVPVMILPDAQLKIGDLPQIQAIFGLPIFVAFRRAAWLDNNNTLALGETAPTANGNIKRLYWHDEGIGIPIATVRGTMGAHLDTGANDTTLRAAAHAMLNIETERNASHYTATVGGAAGVRKTEMQRYPALTFTIAGAPISLTNVKIDDSNEQGAARVGDDFMSQIGRLVLDFETMQVAAFPKAKG
ncbi:retropepsin-like aspartic protease family protein [Gluconobacter albidus]|uniref:retropepsin-like aspartic protease family protein n=1 Tax=Gluconobacter albidus TaxID=318683 RepID=UPI001B8B27E1|nr:retroviral-like aspartic protease family protein [Gluconobacter albidus]